MDFVAQNVFLITIAVISGVALLLPLLRGTSANAVTTGQAVMLINRQNAVLIDVRDASEIKDGQISGSIPVPLAELGKRTDELQKYKERPVILICAGGTRANQGAAVLRRAGFAQVYSLTGGIAAWKDAGQPVVKNGKS